VSTGITSIEPITAARAKFLLHDWLNGGIVSDLAADCSLLRSCVWALSNTFEPVHVLRVLNLALAVSDCKGDVPQRRQELRRILEELCEVRDLVSLPEGRWLPAPTREVPLPDSNERLLVGGLPTSALPSDLRGYVVHHGPYRRVMGSTLSNALGLPSEPVASWAGGPTQDLENWSEEILSSELSPYQEYQDRSRFRVYAPEVSTGSLQIRRWVDRLGDLSGRYLARRERVFGAFEYRVIELTKGTVVATNDLPFSDARRLMYALDWRAKKPIEIKFKTKENYLSIIVRSELPGPEQRLFAAIGNLQVPDEAYYPRTWTFPEGYSKIVFDTLEALKITLVEGNIWGFQA
jgi:hypothetical protein